MSRTSLGQRNDQMRRQDVSSLRQVGSAVRVPAQEQYLQPTLDFQAQIENFLFMRERYAKAEGQLGWEGALGQTYLSVKDDFGVCIFKNGDRYIGYWKDRRMDGMGVYVFYEEDPISRIIYLGQLHQGRFHGIGKLARFQDGQGTMIYYGGWLEGRKSHQGRYYYQHPHTHYFGFWANDQKHGEAKLTFPGGEFTGTWHQDKRQGFGRLKKTEAGLTLVYEGNWEGDQMLTGKVTYYDSTNAEVGRYDGQFLKGRRHGKGIYSWRGVIFEGEFANDCIKGEGTIEFGKTTLKGHFESDQGALSLAEARGQITYASGDVFEGQLVIEQGAVQRRGGVYRFANGDSAQGQFAQNPRGELLGRFIYHWRNGENRQFG